MAGNRVRKVSPVQVALSPLRGLECRVTLREMVAPGYLAQIASLSLFAVNCGELENSCALSNQYFCFVPSCSQFPEEHCLDLGLESTRRTKVEYQIQFG